MARTSAKCKYKASTLLGKCVFIKRVNYGETPTAIFKVYNIGQATVYILGNKEKFMRFVDDTSVDRKHIRSCKFSDVEDSLFTSSIIGL